jgi:Ca-activated chloride channel family protein
MRFASTFPEYWRRSRPIRAAAIATLMVVSVVQASAQTLFRSETNLVALQVTVVDQQRRYVPDLRIEDFNVLEEGHPQTISLFAAGPVPLDLMLLLETSASMVGILSIARQAALNFVRRLGPDDRAGVILINDRVRIASALTNSAVELEHAIQAAPISGGTALYDALYIALKEFTRGRRPDYRMRRQALIVLTDGEDNVSHLTFDDVLRDARSSSVMVYTIVPVQKPRSYERLTRSRVQFEMHRLAEDSGGRAFTPERLEDLAGAYEEITTELSHQYWLAYTPSRSTRGFRRVAVRLANPLLRARTRAGYYAIASRSSTSATTDRQW